MGVVIRVCNEKRGDRRLGGCNSLLWGKTGIQDDLYCSDWRQWGLVLLVGTYKELVPEEESGYGVPRF